MARSAYWVHWELHRVVCCAVCCDWKGESESRPCWSVSIICSTGKLTTQQYVLLELRYLSFKKTKRSYNILRGWTDLNILRCFRKIKWGMFTCIFMKNSYANDCKIQWCPVTDELKYPVMYIIPQFFFNPPPHAASLAPVSADNVLKDLLKDTLKPVDCFCRWPCLWTGWCECLQIWRTTLWQWREWRSTLRPRLRWT